MSMDQIKVPMQAERDNQSPVAGGKDPVKRLASVFFLILVLWICFVVIWANVRLREFHAENPGLPFGVIADSSGYYLQDFSYHMIFFKGLKEHYISSPYDLREQEKLMRHLVPQVPAGMAHAYSPVAFILMSPLLDLPGDKLYLIYTLLGAFATLLLFYSYLLPRVKSRLQVCAMAVAVTGVCLTAAFITGQSTLITTPLLALFWIRLQKGKACGSQVEEGVLALLFWILCLKPNVALIPFFLLVGARRWRVLAISFVLLLATWTATAGYYGGWWHGLRDYFQLLTHYYPGDFPAYMRRDMESPLVHFWAPSRNVLFFVLNLTLIVARWTGRITASEHFQGVVWAFLLLSPYLLVVECWILVLLLVEGSFFATATPFTAGLKLLLLFGILDLRVNVNSPIDFIGPCKWILFVWIVSTVVTSRLQQKNPLPGSEL